MSTIVFTQKHISYLEGLKTGALYLKITDFWFMLSFAFIYPDLNNIQVIINKSLYIS